MADFDVFIEKMYFAGRYIEFLYLTLLFLCGMFIQ